jgi:D-psicose/D-tagatose/L-ribulose 3-epimerase
MKLAISNIAWEKHDDLTIFEMLRKYGVQGVEIAPTKIWPSWKGASYENARQYRKFMQDEGFQISSMQAILFDKPQLQIFNMDSHAEFFKHIQLIAELADGFGSSVIVFGAPKNRRRWHLGFNESIDIASDFFYKAGEICSKHNCCICIEHNPIEYNCDFITNVSDAEYLVKRVNHKDFKLHIDSAGIHMCKGDFNKVIRSVGSFEHYHISEPMLEPIYKGCIDHASYLKDLRNINYEGWVSIEMKQPASLEILEQSLRHIHRIFQIN